MATILNNAAYMGLPINIKRGNRFLWTQPPFGILKLNWKLTPQVVPPLMSVKF